MPLSDREKKYAARRVITKRINDLTVKFIKLPDDETTSFDVNGDTVEAKKFIQSMRVRLSRLRMKIREKNRTVKDFKMRILSLSYDEVTNITNVVLTKSAPLAQIEEEINDIFN